MSKKNDSLKHSCWKFTFIVIVCIASLFISIASVVYVYSHCSSVIELENKIEQYISTPEENSDILKSNAYIDFCETINNKADNALNQLITIVGIFASIITILGVLFTFKAPKDIEKDIFKLKELTDKTHNLVEEQEYLLLVFDAVNEKTAYHRIRELSKIITEHPNKWKAYLYRGYAYDDKKDYDSAIADYKKAKKLGCDEEQYLNAISISISNRYQITKNAADRDLALSHISKAIDINPDNPIYYINRGSIYFELNNFDTAEQDFDMAIAIDPENSEAYSNKASLYLEKSKNAEKEAAKTYKEKAIEFIQKALDLNFEDSDNLKRLNALLKEKFTATESEYDSFDENINNQTRETHNISAIENSIDELVFAIDERLGDLLYKEERYIESITSYTDALTKFNIPSQDLIKANISVIQRICGKIKNCKEKMPSIDIYDSINRKLHVLIPMIGIIAYEYYQNNEFETAGKYYECVTTLSGFGTGYSNNLAYMIRRKEYNSNIYKITDLLACKTPEESSSYLRINRALCMIQGIGYEYDIEKALKEINHCESEIENALEWWSNDDIVGEAESNIVILLLSIMKKIELDENFNINKMIQCAICDGYNIPDNILELADSILSDCEE